MLVNSYHFSALDPCGVAIFSQHLCEALSQFGHEVLAINLRTATGLARTPVEILHYVPSSFAGPEASRALITLLNSRRESHKLFVILHGLHSYGEDRLLDDTPCPNQAEHIRLMLLTAESLTALSESVARACHTWHAKFGGRARILRLDHPGLFALTTRLTATRGSYAFIGGISRSKKRHTAGSISTLLDLCWRQGVRVWEHWTNLPASAPVPRAWRQTSGVLNDGEWSDLISHARVVLCPYQTRIQTVSGLISEALSAHRFVLSTSFELAVEMKARVPALVLIEDNIQRWPALIRELPLPRTRITTGIPTWDSFARAMALEFAPMESKGPPL
jgi:hypothetical protein